MKNPEGSDFLSLSSSPDEEDEDLSFFKKLAKD
jgi:hypothetical protein